MPLVGDVALAKIRQERGLENAEVLSRYKKAVTMEWPDGKIVETMFPRKLFRADGTSLDTGWKPSADGSLFAYHYQGDEYQVGVGRRGNARFDSGNLLTVRSHTSTSRFISAGSMYWRDNAGNRSLALAANGAATLTIGSNEQDNFATWPGAYGPGTRARFAGQPGFVNKAIHIDDLWARMARPGPALNAARTWLHIPFRLELEAGLTVWVFDRDLQEFVEHPVIDGGRILSMGEIEFRDARGEPVHRVRVPWVRPDNRQQRPARVLAELPPNHPDKTPPNTAIRLRIEGGQVDFEIMVRYGYLNNVSGGVLIDPTVDVDTTDGNTAALVTNISWSTTTNAAQIAYYGGGPYYGVAFNRFISYTFDETAGDTIDSAYASMTGYAGSDTEDAQVGFVVAGNPAMPANQSAAETQWGNRSTGINEGNITSSPHTSGDLSTDMQSSVSGHTAGDAITVLWWGTSAGTSYASFAQDQDAYESPGDTNLTFTFTAGASEPEGPLVGGKLIRGGILTRGRLVG